MGHKTIPVSEETHHAVEVFRVNNKFRTFDEAVQSLLSRPEFTDEELDIMMSWKGTSENESGSSKEEEELGEKLKSIYEAIE